MSDIEKLLDEISDLMSINVEGHSKEIFDKIDQVLNIDPLNKDTLIWKALLYQHLSDYGNAIETYKNVLAIDPNNDIAKEAIKDCIEFESWDNKKNSFNEYKSDNIGLNREETKNSIWCKIPCELIFGLKIIILLGLLITCFQSQILSFLYSGNDKKVLETTSNFQELYVNQPSELNNLRKEEVYNYRKMYVKDSLFYSDNYSPNERVFGQIQDYKPWWGNIKCQKLGYEGDYHENIEGNSKQSIQINNPNALVGLSSPFIPWDRNDSDFCTADYSNFIPASLKYDKQKQLIVSEYPVSREFLNFYVRVSNQNKPYPMQLSGLNALDFGYKYVYAYDLKNIKMTEDNNITQRVSEFRDFIHLGGSCKYEGGCNNISPMQNDKMFSVADLPAEINLKLWKKQPNNSYQKADMYYRIIFTEQ